MIKTTEEIIEEFEESFNVDEMVKDCKEDDTMNEDQKLMIIRKMIKCFEEVVERLEADYGKAQS